jgi:6-phosphofructokinase 1
MEAIFKAVRKRAQHGKKFSLVVAAEGAKEKGGNVIMRKSDLKNPYPVKLGGVGAYLAEKIEQLTGLETRSANLGHIQRGGSPVPEDRNLGTLFGTHAVELIRQQRWGRMVCLHGSAITSIPIGQAVNKLKLVTADNPLVLASEAVGISFGR